MTARTAGQTAPGGAFSHPALFYRTAEEYAAGVGVAVRSALRAGEPVLVAVPGPRLEMLREMFAGDAAAVSFADMAELGRNPGRILAVLLGFAEQHPGGAATIVGEPIWPGRSHPEILEAVRHEALINAAFAGRRATVLCPYDAAALPARVLADAERTHPALIGARGSAVSTRYTAPAAVCADCDEELPEPPDTLVFDYGPGRLRDVRDCTEAWVRGTGLARVRRADLVLAVAEATANSLAHGGGYGTLRLWTTASGTVVAETRDGGWLADPLAGRRRPSAASADGGRGLWLIHQLCDLVEIRAGSDSLTLRMHMTP